MTDPSAKKPHKTNDPVLRLLFDARDFVSSVERSDLPWIVVLFVLRTVAFLIQLRFGYIALRALLRISLRLAIFAVAVLVTLVGVARLLLLV